MEPSEQSAPDERENDAPVEPEPEPGPNGKAPAALPAAADDAVVALESHLREQEAAEQFETAPTPSPSRRYEQTPAPTRSYQVPAPTPPKPVREPARGNLRVIEELYGRYPLGQGHSVRVYRTEPKYDVYRQQASGWIGDMVEPLGMADFTGEYGGGKYVLQVIGPNDPARGDTSPRVVAEMKLEIPGQPRKLVPPVLVDEGDHMMSQGRSYPYPGPFAPPAGMPSEKVQMTQLTIEADERKRLEQREQEQARRELDHTRAVLEAAKPSDTAYEALRDQNRQAIDQLQRQHDETVKMLQAQTVEQQRVIGQKDDELRQLRADILTAEKRAVDATNNAETKAVAEIRERNRIDRETLIESHRKETEELRRRYDDDIKRMQADYTSRLDSELHKYQADLDRSTDRADKDRQRMEELSQREREALRSDYAEKERRMRESYEDRIRSQTDTFNARIQDMERNTQREIQAAKDQQALAMQTIKESYASTSKVEGTAASLRIQSLETEVGNLKARSEQLDRENEKMRAEIHKPLARALKDTEESARLIGMVRKEDVEPAEAAPATADMDWKSVLLGVGKAAVERAPELLAKLGEVRQAHAAAAAAPVQVATRQLPAGPPAMAPAGVRQRRRGVPPTPGAQPPVPPPYGGMPAMTGAPTYVEPPVMPAPMQPPGPTAPPSSGVAMPLPVPQTPVQTSAAPPGASPFAPGVLEAQWDAQGRPPAAPTAPTPSVAPPAAPAQPAAAPTQPGGDADLGMFVSVLEGAITGGTDPAQFAAALIGQLGIEKAVQAVTQMNPEKVIELVSTSPAAAQSPIMTRAGEKYLEAVWAAAYAQLRQAGAQI